MKPVIRIHFTDFWEDFSPADNLYLDILRQKYDVQHDPANPDFLLCSCFGYDHLRYSCVKICCLGENLTPDFNAFDYAYGFDRMTFEDRYLRYPLYRLYMASEDLQVRPANFWAEEITKKTKFCNFLYSNNRNASPEREHFFHLLSQYKKIDSGGGFLNNIGHRVGDKYTWQREYKFSIAFENSSKKGYITEKIYEALRAHTIPIYWGDPTVVQDFNSKRFINCHDYPSFEAVVDAVQQLDTDHARYYEMLQQPWFVGENPKLPREDAIFIQFFNSIISQGPVDARRVIRDGFTNQYITHMHDVFALFPFLRLLLRIKNFFKKVRRIFR